MTYEMPRPNQPEVTGTKNPELPNFPEVKIVEQPFDKPRPDNRNVVLTTIMGIPDPEIETVPVPSGEVTRH